MLWFKVNEAKVVLVFKYTFEFSNYWTATRVLFGMYALGFSIDVFIVGFECNVLKLLRKSGDPILNAINRSVRRFGVICG